MLTTSHTAYSSVLSGGYGAVIHAEVVKNNAGGTSTQINGASLKTVPTLPASACSANCLGFPSYGFCTVADGTKRSSHWSMAMRRRVADLMPLDIRL